MINIVDDLFFIENFKNYDFETIKNEIKWETMFSQGQPVPRLVSLQGNLDNGLIPLYRHPVDKQPTINQFSPKVNEISKELSKVLKQDFNHVLIQYYRNGNDNIGQHSDKTLDIKHNTNIVNLSLGATRTIKFKHKNDSTKKFKINLTNNSVLILGPIANKNYLHYIDKDKRDLKFKTKDETDFNGERISLTFRTINTFLTPDNKIIGQGAKKGFEIIDNSPDEKLRLLKSFSIENKTNDFNWEEIYGLGFNCIDLEGL